MKEIRQYRYFGTVMPAKSDSGVMLCLQSYQDLESIDHLCINPILSYTSAMVMVLCLVLPFLQL